MDRLGKKRPFAKVQNPNAPPLPAAAAAAAAVCVVGVRFVHVCVRMAALCKALFDVRQHGLPLARDQWLAG